MNHTGTNSAGKKHREIGAFFVFGYPLVNLPGLVTLTRRAEFS
jgi:hypothetical protein